MKIIVSICENINNSEFDIPTVMKSAPFIFVDLDGTLRKGSHWEELDHEAVNTFKKIYQNHNTYILTNNTTHSAKEIAKHLNIDVKRVITPLHALPKNIPLGKSIYVIGNKDTINDINEIGYITNSFDKSYDAILIANNYFMTSEDWEIISINKSQTVFITDHCNSVTRKYCSDTVYAHHSQNDLFPDIGSYTDIIKNVYSSNVVLLGKPTIDILYNFGNLEKSLFIGDSLNSDIGLANKLKGFGILIDTTKPTGYCPVDNCYIVRHIKDICFL